MGCVAGDARENRDGVNDSMWHAVQEQARDDNALEKGQAGYYAWLEIREYPALTAWVGEDLPGDDDDERAPDEENTRLVDDYVGAAPQIADLCVA
eukprot:jgi/Tetstr1/456020/TSEL_042796.t1